MNGDTKEPLEGKVPFYKGYPQPLWVQVDMLGPGDILVAKTQSNFYYLFVIGPRVGLMWSCSKPSNPLEVHIYGGYDLETNQPSWGKIQVGAPLLVADISTASEAIKTSPIECLYLRKATVISASMPAVQKPSAHKVFSPNPVGLRPLGAKPVLSSQTPKVMPRILVKPGSTKA